MSEAALAEAATLLAQAESVLFVTGAGVSADSGLPTYRGVGGLYEEAQPEEGMPIEALLSGGTFARRPELTWKYLYQVERASRGATFNRAHEIMARLEQELPRVWVLTQNVDGLHRLAGSQNIIDIHGDIHEMLCTQCGWRATVRNFDELGSTSAAPPSLPRPHPTTPGCGPAPQAPIHIPPECPDCASMVRPDVVLFDEMLQPRKVAAMERELKRGFDVVFSVGTSSLFPYIVAPVLQARSRGLPSVEINPAQTEISAVVDVKVTMGAAQAMQAIWERFLATHR